MCATGLSQVTPVEEVTGINNWEPHDQKELLLAPAKKGTPYKKGTHLLSTPCILHSERTPSQVPEAGDVGIRSRRRTAAMNLFRLSGDCLPHSQAAEDRVGFRSMRFFGYLSKSPIMSDGEEWRGMGKTVTWIHGLRHLPRRLRSEEGQSLVEFALAFMVFIFLIFAIFDFGHLFFVEMDVQNAIQEAGRYGSTGNHLPDPNNPGNNLSRVTSIINTFENDAMGVQVSNIQVTSLNGGSTSAGGPGDMMTISGTVNMPLITPLIAHLFPNGQFTFTASTTVMNEPFPPGQTN